MSPTRLSSERKLLPATNSTSAANGGADLRDDVRDQTGFLRVDLRDGAFELEINFDGRIRGYGLAQVNAQRRLLIVERKHQRCVVAGVAHLDNFQAGFV